MNSAIQTLDLRYNLRTMMIAIAVVALSFAEVHEIWPRLQESQRISRRIALRQKLLRRIGEGNNAWSRDWHEKHVLKPKLITLEDLKQAEAELLSAEAEISRTDEMVQPGKQP